MFCFKQRTADEVRSSDWRSDVCSSDLHGVRGCGLYGGRSICAGALCIGGGRRHVVAPVPGTARGTRARLFSLCLSFSLCRHRSVRRLYGDGPQGGGAGADACPSGAGGEGGRASARSEEHTSELQSLMRTSYAALCLQKQKNNH